MSLLHVLIAAAVMLTGTPAQAIEDPRDQDAALAGAQAGRLMNFGDIRNRVDRRIGGKFLGCDCDPNDARYTMRYMRGNEVIEVEVDARTGNILGTRK